MKKRFEKIAKKYGKLPFINYISKRSDHGVQMYMIDIKVSDELVYTYRNEYWTGDKNAKENVLIDFNFHLSQYNRTNA